MKKILLAASAIALTSTPAFAASTDSDTVDVNASVAKECSIEDVTTITLGELNINESPGVDALQIRFTKKEKANPVYMSCNFNNQMTLSAPTPLTSASAASLTPSTGSAPFTNQIDYRFRALNYDTGIFGARSTTRPTVTRSTGPIHKQIEFEARVDKDDNAGIRPYAANDYTATATISITTV